MTFSRATDSWELHYFVVNWNGDIETRKNAGGSSRSWWPLSSISDASQTRGWTTRTSKKWRESPDKKSIQCGQMWCVPSKIWWFCIRNMQTEGLPLQIAFVLAKVFNYTLISWNMDHSKSLKIWDSHITITNSEIKMRIKPRQSMFRLFD